MAEPQHFLNGKVTLYPGDCMDVLAELPENSVEAVCTDPPYELAFMNRAWDRTGIAFRPETWAAVLRVMKPGAHLVAFAAPKNAHRMICAIEDAGFEIRDGLMWLFGSGFPKSHDISKAIDRAAGAEREVVGDLGTGRLSQTGRNGSSTIRMWGREDGSAPITAPATDEAARWQGFGTSLKPAYEPICLARKPLSESSIAANVLRWGTGALNIDGCRVGVEGGCSGAGKGPQGDVYGDGLNGSFATPVPGLGRWPANLLHDGSDEVVGAFPETTTNSTGAGGQIHGIGYMGGAAGIPMRSSQGDSGSAARFFKTCSFSEGELAWTSGHANCADDLLSLRSEAAVSALSRAAERSTPGLALNEASYQAPSMTVMASELSVICALVTTAIQNIVTRSLPELRPERLTLSNSLASIVATRVRTGTITITISLLKSNGSAEPVTFSITETSAEAGAPASEAKRLWYTAKADQLDRAGSRHPTVKPLDLIQYLCRLITPPGGTVLDLFAGTGTTGEAAWREGFRAILIEREAEYQQDIARRMEWAMLGPESRAREQVKLDVERGKVTAEALPLFGGAAE